ncbi:Serine proteases trypsin domain [Trinorchestia longiramus]|nr:Serine proteases trypsin domain [Trinorchestia longiramus]
MGRCPAKQCVLLDKCPSLAARLRSRGHAQRSSVRQAMCGYNGIRAKVCCSSTDLVDAELVAPQRVHMGQITVPERETAVMHRVKVTTDEPQTKLESQDRMGLLPSQCGRARVSSRIFGGTSTPLGSYPWIVAMRYKQESEDGGLEKVFCAGSLINSRYVVTAAHCLDAAWTKGWQLTTLALGDWRLSTDPDCAYKACAPRAVVAQVEKAIVPAEYNSTTLDHDIALLRLDQPVNFSWAIQPICLPPKTFARGELTLGTTVVAIGWGMTKSFQNSDVLMEATIPIANPSICKEKFPYNFFLNSKQMCVGGGVSDTCLGDSGGPVMKLNSAKKFYLLAVTSFGSMNCGIEGHPAVYTSVAHFSDWIQASMKP